MQLKKNAFYIFAYLFLLTSVSLLRHIDVQAQVTTGQTVVACQAQAAGCTFFGNGAIQKAIDQAQASSGNVVEVREGTYSENLTVGAPSLYIIGAGKGKTVISGGMTVTGTNNSIYQIEKLTLQNSTTNGLKIMGAGTILVNKVESLNHAGNGIDVGGSGVVVIKGSLIAGNTKGIRVASSNLFDVTNTVIAQNRSEGIEQLGTQMTGFGIIHSVVYNNGRDGLKATIDSYNPRFVIRNSIFMGNKSYGVSSANEPDADVAELYMSFNKNIFFGNTSGCSNHTIICDSEGTLANSDPKFTGAPVFNMKLASLSPAIDTGYDFDPDGTVADRGLYGGIYACEYDGSLSYCAAPNDPSASPSPEASVSPRSSGRSCALKVHGDANCDGLISNPDFEIWRSEFKNAGSGLNSDFNADATINSTDFEIWKGSFVNR
ncbi:right-handed parallel beta-helix repeat-containing protein [Candidatus Woesebacteria bacterium]|nr:right-handed parallel beta-helix repeat-containing protein [Candidatus Woesebacteria bacterium]